MSGIFIQVATLLLLPRLRLWSRDKTAKGIAVVATAAVGRIDEAIIEVEAVGEVSIRVGARRPVITVLTSAAYKQNVYRCRCIPLIDIPAPHKEERKSR